METYQEMLQAAEDATSTSKIDDLPLEQQAWLRATQ